MAWIRPVQSLLLAALPLTAFIPFASSSTTTAAECPMFFSDYRWCTPKAPRSFLPVESGIDAETEETNGPDLDVLTEVLKSIDVMQSDYFAAWLGTWPDSIDWTGAVVGTHVSGALHSFSEALTLMESNLRGVEDWKVKENLIENYFTQIVSYYFGENAFEIRGQAYDDILWVVLGWLEAVKFVNTHTDLHYSLQTQGEVDNSGGAIGTVLGNQTWHGNLFVPAFSHRARVFWDLASKGWDTKLCGGGMTWNPKLLVYKNAITNELFIAGSISMYLYFPGDDNTAPFSGPTDKHNGDASSSGVYVGTREPKYLKAAVDGYKWLTSSNMTNAQGLFTDGFHISGLADPTNNNTACDERNEMVFTYNQGVLLTGQRGLWEATGSSSYLHDGHKLIQNAINATGWDLPNGKPSENYSTLAPDTLPQWYGLGRLGVMEDQCDAAATCSQDAQTFKGIFFHHLAYFCAPLKTPIAAADFNIDTKAFVTTEQSHRRACSAYGKWLEYNAEAALATRDKDGKFGTWWTAGLLTNYTGDWPTTESDGIDHAAAGTDYRNYGVPNNTIWQAHPPSDATDLGQTLPFDVPATDAESPQPPLAQPPQQAPIRELRRRRTQWTDPNKRGRGRTVETQSGGLALLRAYWNIAHAP